MFRSGAALPYFVADAHFGKDAVFRARGIPVPVGSTANNLMRLDILIAEFEPAMLVFLGDLLHAREAHAKETLDALQVWRARHAGLRVVLVEGNHDRHAGALPGTLGVEYVQEPWPIGPWALCHQPQRVEGAYVLAGHLHPVYRISTRTDSVRAPCFGSVRSVACCRLLEALRGERAKKDVWLGRGCFWWCRSG